MRETYCRYTPKRTIPAGRVRAGERKNMDITQFENLIRIIVIVAEVPLWVTYEVQKRHHEDTGGILIIIICWGLMMIWFNVFR